MLRRLVATVVLGSLTVSAVACHRYMLVARPLDFIATQKPAQVLVTRTDGTTYSITGPQVFGDTVVGYVNGQYQQINFNTPGQVRVRSAARAQTALLIGMGVVGLAGIVYLVTGSFGSGRSDGMMACDDDPYGCMMVKVKP